MSPISNAEIPVLELHDESRQGEAFEDLNPIITHQLSKKFFIESYGCAMNFSDSEIVASILIKEGYVSTNDFMESDLVLINTCSIRENAEQRVRTRLGDLKKVKKNNPGALIGVLGCMAERLKSKLLDEEKFVDLVVGPDAYRDLPKLIRNADGGQKGVNVLLSREETYSDVSPVRLNSNGVTAFISIMRGCNNMCSFCVVPFTRGRERSRNSHSIVAEATQLFQEGYREVTLLGQNVDSYLWKNEDGNEKVSFADLLEKVAMINPLLRVRFSTSHPKDITDQVLHTIAKYPNICNYIHLPIQSGNNRMLKLMNRTYTREWYQQKIESIRKIIPGCSISTDMIVGFCTETEEEHKETLSMMEYVKYDMAYMFKYSERPGTPAFKKYEDDVPEEIKSMRLSEMVTLQHAYQLEKHKKEIGNISEVLIEGISKKNSQHFYGRSSQNRVIIFPKENFKIGEYVNVKLTSYTSATLMGEAI